MVICSGAIFLEATPGPGTTAEILDDYPAAVGQRGLCVGATIGMVIDQRDFLPLLVIDLGRKAVRLECPLTRRVLHEKPFAELQTRFLSADSDVGR